MEELSDLLLELESHRGNYPEALRLRGGAYIRAARGAGKSQRLIRSELGVSKDTVVRWAKLGQSPKIQPVRQISPQRLLSTDSVVTMVSPQGWRLEGISSALGTELFRNLAQ